MIEVSAIEMVCPFENLFSKKLIINWGAAPMLETEREFKYPLQLL